MFCAPSHDLFWQRCREDILAAGENVLWMSMRPIYSRVQFRLQFLHLIFCLDDLPIAKSGMLKFSNMYWSWSLPSELLTFALYTSMLWSSMCVYLEWLSPVAEMAPMLLYNDLPWKYPFAMFYLKSMATAISFFIEYWIPFFTFSLWRIPQKSPYYYCYFIF